MSAVTTTAAAPKKEEAAATVQGKAFDVRLSLVEQVRGAISAQLALERAIGPFVEARP